MQLTRSGLKLNDKFGQNSPILTPVTPACKDEKTNPLDAELSKYILFIITMTWHGT